MASSVAVVVRLESLAPTVLPLPPLRAGRPFLDQLGYVAPTMTLQPVELCPGVGAQKEFQRFLVVSSCARQRPADDLDGGPVEFSAAAHRGRILCLDRRFQHSTHLGRRAALMHYVNQEPIVRTGCVI